MRAVGPPPGRPGARRPRSPSYELGAALGVALLGSLQTLLYRADLPEPVARLGDGAVLESLARATDVLGGGAALDAARESFTWGMQVTAVAAAVLLALAAATAWRVIPSTRSRFSAH
jgi:DHA2 family multidrug resistance protein-like MFS transporter